MEKEISRIVEKVHSRYGLEEDKLLLSDTLERMDCEHKINDIKIEKEKVISTIKAFEGHGTRFLKREEVYMALSKYGLEKIIDLRSDDFLYDTHFNK